ncbi:MAG: hypothetical protein J6L76_07125 [Clostridia bacterium]|nr:hypothetical protein [Clostridia bacterium]
MKKCLSLILVVLILMTSALPIAAAESHVTYSGNSGDFIFEPGSKESPTDLFPDFKGVMPGDVLTQKITVKNQADNKVKVKIYLRALGAHGDSRDFLSRLRLQVQTSVDNKMAYMFDSTADATAQLTEWYCLGTLYSGGKVNLDVTLTVPVELENIYQSQAGYLDWEFRVEEFSVEDDDPKPPPTGEEPFPIIWVVLIGVTGFVLILLLILRKKRQDQEEEA